MYFRTATTVPQRSVKDLLQLWESIANPGAPQVEESRSQELRPMSVLTNSGQGPTSPMLVNSYGNPSTPTRQQPSPLSVQPERLMSPQAREANSFNSTRVNAVGSPVAFSPTQVLNRDAVPIPQDIEGLKTLMSTLQGELEAVRRELEATKRARAANPHIVATSISEPLSPEREQALNQISDWLENEVQTVQTRLSTMAVSPSREQPQIYVQIPSPSKTQADMMIPQMFPQKPQADPDDTANMKWLRGMVETLALSQLQFQQQLLQQQQQQQQQQQRLQQQPSPLPQPLQSPLHAQASFDVNGAANLASSEPPFTPNSNDYVSASSSVMGNSPSRPATAASPSRPGTASSSTRPESGYLNPPSAVSIQTVMSQGEGGGGGARSLSARPHPQSKYQRFFSGRERSGSFNSFFSASSLDDSDDYDAYPNEQEEFPPVQQQQQQQQQQALAVPHARSRSASRSSNGDQHGGGGGGERVRTRSNSAATDHHDSGEKGGYGSSQPNTPRRGSSSTMRGTSPSPNVRFLDQALSGADNGAYYNDDHDDYNDPSQIPYTPAESRRESEVSVSRKSLGGGSMKANHRLAPYEASSPETESSLESPGGGGYGYMSSERDSEDELNLNRLMKMRRSSSQVPPSDGSSGQGRGGYGSSDASSPSSSSFSSSSNSNTSRDFSRRSQMPVGFRPSLTVLNESTRRSQDGIERIPAIDYAGGGGGEGGRNRSGSLGSRGKNEPGWGSSPALNRLSVKDARALTPMRQRQHSDESFMVMADKRTTSFVSLNDEDDYGPPPSRGGGRESFSRNGGRSGAGSGWDDRESRNGHRDSYSRRSGYERERDRESRGAAEYRESYSRSGRREEEYYDEETEYRESYSRSGGGGGRERERIEYEREREQREDYRESYSRGRERGGDEEWERSERGERQSVYRESVRSSRASLFDDGGSVGGSRNSLYSSGNSGGAGKDVLVAIPVARGRSNSTGTTGGSGTVRRPGLKFKDPDPTPTPRLAVVRL